MKIVAFDLETTGLAKKGPRKVLQVSLVIDDLEKRRPMKDLPHLTFFVQQEEIAGEPYALVMNSWILKDLAEFQKRGKSAKTKYPVLTVDEVEEAIYSFLSKHFDMTSYDKPLLCGFNTGQFDLQFLPEHIQEWFNHRVLDVTSLYFNGKKMRSSKDLADAEGVPAPSHDAYEDNLTALELVRKKFPVDDSPQ